MCGNGSRCVARLAYEIGFAPSRHIFETDVGCIEAEVFPKEKVVKVQLTSPTDYKEHIEIKVDGEIYKADYVNTGVPHTVIFLKDTKKIEVERVGRKI